MKSYFKFFVSAGVVVIMLFLLNGFLPVAEANHSWNGYHWGRTANSFTLKLGDNVASLWDSYLATASAKWSLSSVLDTMVVAGNSNKSKSCKAVLGRVEICNSKYGNNGWLGLASIWITGGTHITQGVVKLNDTYFNTSAYDKPAWRNLVMCQEVAHTFGLDHQDEDFDNPNLGTCMDYTGDPDGTIKSQLDNQFPNQHDYDQLKAIYTHLDSINTVNALAPVRGKNKNSIAIGTDEFDFSEPSDFGKSIRKDKQGKDSVFEKTLDKNNKIITHIFWAE